MKLSNQGLGALMLALQNSLMNETDIVPVLQGFKFYLQEGQLFVENPPSVQIPEEFVYSGDAEEDDVSNEETLEALRKFSED